MNQIQTIPSSVSINQTHKTPESVPSSVVRYSDSTDQANNSGLFDSFLKQNIKNLANLQNQNGGKMGNRANSEAKEINMQVKAVKYSEVKPLAKYATIEDSDSDEEQSGIQDNSINVQSNNYEYRIFNELSKSQQIAFNRSSYQKKLTHQKTMNQKKKPNKNKFIKNFKQQSKLNLLCQTAASENAKNGKNVQDKCRKLLVKQISKNRQLNQKLLKTQQQNSVLRHLIYKFNKQNSEPQLKYSNKKQKIEDKSSKKMKQISGDYNGNIAKIKTNKIKTKIKKEQLKQKNNKNVKLRMNTEINIEPLYKKSIMEIKEKVVQLQLLLRQHNMSVNKGQKNRQTSKISKKGRMKTEIRQGKYD